MGCFQIQLYEIMLKKVIYTTGVEFLKELKTLELSNEKVTISKLNL